MLNNVDLKKRADKQTYKNELKELQAELAAAQLKIKELGIPVMIVFEGFSSSGKGTQIARLLYPLDPRLFDVHTFGRVTEEMRYRPFLWSYWTKTPERGRIAIFDKSWHRLCLSDANENWQLTENERKHFHHDVNAFERMLSDDGVLVVKFFLHISKTEQKNRFAELQKSTNTSWRVDQNDLRQNREYEKALKQYDDMLVSTSTINNPWVIVEADDGSYATLKIYRTLLKRLRAEIGRKEAKIHIPAQTPYKHPAPELLNVLDGVMLNKDISDADYKVKLAQLQARMAQLMFGLYAKRKSVVIVYEGWDASGKGGNIKRLTQEVDPRGYDVISIAAPTPVELSHHYLWRFWNRMPKDGHMAIFDRSWYGRVLVERVEGFATADEWQRAFGEINDMEKHMANNGTIVLKFWLQIDKDEQLSRFNARMTNPLKTYKITDEDWRNREKWQAYEDAVNEMLLQTQTAYAPWHIIEANSKKYARIRTLEIVIKALESALK